MLKKYMLRTGILLGLLVLSLVLRFILIGNASVIRLATAPALTGVVAQSLYANKTGNSIPVAGKDFVLKDAMAFEQGQWVVSSVVPLHNQFDPSVVVLEKMNSGYQVVLGPGSDFDKSYLLSMPTDVGNNLMQRRVINESAQ